MSVADEDIPPEVWSEDGTVSREGCRLLPLFNALNDQVRQDGGRLELYAAEKKMVLLAIRKDGKVMAQQPLKNDLEGAAKALICT